MLYLELRQTGEIRHYLSKKSPRNCCVCLSVQDRLDRYCNSLLPGYPEYRLFSKSVGPTMSLLHFTVFTGYLPSREPNTNYSRSSLRPKSTFRSFFVFTLFPSGSALLQAPERSEYHQSELSPVVSALSPTWLSPGSNFLEPTPCFCSSRYLCQFFQVLLVCIRSSLYPQSVSASSLEPCSPCFSSSRYLCQFFQIFLVCTTGPVYTHRAFLRAPCSQVHQYRRARCLKTFLER